MIQRWFPLLVIAGLSAACSATGPVEDESEDEGALKGKGCSGAACKSLAEPVALTRGKLAAVGNELYWIGVGTANNAEGVPVDELQHCTLPTCASVSRLPLVLADGTAIRASELHAIDGGVFFVGDKRGVAEDSFFVSDGVTLHGVYDGYDRYQNSDYAVDANGFAIYDGRQDKLTHCPLNGLTVGTCKSLSGPLVAWGGAVTVTPTRVAVGLSTRVRSFDRATLGSPQTEAVSSQDVTWLTAIDELIFGVQTEVMSENGHAVHGTSISRAGFGVTMRGVLSALTTDAGRLYVATRGEGDVFGVPNAGFITRVSSAGVTKTIASAQEPGGVAVAGKKVYWLNRVGPQSDEDPTGVVRYATK